MLWTVVRFPNGSWSYGGSPGDPDYVECEVWQIEAPSSAVAIRRARDRRNQVLRKKAQVAKAQTEN